MQFYSQPRYRLRGLLQLLAASVVGLGTAHAASPRWDIARSGAETTLFYGTPESEDVIVSFSCHASRHNLTIIYPLSQLAPGNGGHMRLALSIDGTNFAFKGIAGVDRTKQHYIEAQTSRLGALLASLEHGSTLTFTVGRKHESMSLAGVKTPLSAFRKSCQSGRK